MGFIFYFIGCPTNWGLSVIPAPQVHVGPQEASDNINRVSDAPHLQSVIREIPPGLGNLINQRLYN